VKVKADKEEALSSLLEQADKAKTDEGKRQTLREYYDLLAKRMKKIDSSLSDWIDTMHSAYLRRLDQVRIEPTIPLTTPPVPEESSAVEPAPAPAAVPSSTPSHRKRKRRIAAVVEASPTPAPSPSASPLKTGKTGKKVEKKAPKKSASKTSPTPAPTPAAKKKAASSNDD
jgi:hypothetical protein